MPAVVPPATSRIGNNNANGQSGENRVRTATRMRPWPAWCALRDWRSHRERSCAAPEICAELGPGQRASACDKGRDFGDVPGSSTAPSGLIAEAAGAVATSGPADGLSRGAAVVTRPDAPNLHAEHECLPGGSHDQSGVVPETRSRNACRGGSLGARASWSRRGAGARTRRTPSARRHVLARVQMWAESLRWSLRYTIRSISPGE